MFLGYGITTPSHAAASDALEMANILLMTKEATDKDRSLKAQTLLSTSVNNNTPEKISGEQVWKKTRLFFWRKSRLNIEKWNFLENTLCYINQGYISTVTWVGGELAMYTHIHILGQLVVTANQPRNLDQYTPAKNEIKPCRLPVWQSTGEFQDMAMELSYIIFWGDVEEFFLSYVYSEKKSLVLYLVAKEKIPNAFILTSFKKHFHEIMNERWHNKEFYDVFFYLPSTTDRKEKTNSTETMWISVL